MAKILVVTNSYKRKVELVERSLFASLKQIPDDSAVYFVDQNSPPLKLAVEIEQNQKFHHIKVQTTAVSAARNSFEIPQEFDWIIFCDDDGHMAPDYITTFSSLIQKNPQIEIMAGSIVRDDNHEFYSPRHKIGGTLKKFRFTKLLMGSNLAVKVDTFKKLKGFDDQFGAGAFWGSGEETDFCWKAYFANVEMEFFPELIVYHIKPYAGEWIDSIKKGWRYGRGKGALVAKWLFIEKEPKVLFEFFEMTIIPLVQIIASIFKFKFSEIPIYFSVFFSRLYGLMEYLLRRLFRRQNAI